MGIRLGYQIPNFTYPGGNERDIFPTVAAQAQEAEKAGFDTVLVMDHFYQLPGLGTPDEPMLEAYTTLGALAGLTSTIQLSTLVTGNTYRNPAMLAKTVTTLDVISGGRAVLALGAGWYELEHEEMGYEYGTFGQRFERLDEALQIISPMLHGERPQLDGKWYTAKGPRNYPRLRDVPIMLGGAGEKKTFRMAAQYADHLNIICGPDEIPTKLAALAQRCEEVGRDRATLETSYLAFAVIDDKPGQAAKLVDGYLTKIGADAWPEEARNNQLARIFSGTPDEVAEKVAEKITGVGIDGVIINMITNGHEPGAITVAAEALKPLVS